MVGVESSGFVECTPIQEAAMPHILAGRDLAGLAQTGTGKTAAFVLPLIHRIISGGFKDWRRPNFILVLVPTRELAEQVYECVAKFGKPAEMKATAIYGGTGYEGQKSALKNGVEFVVATPGRLIDLYKEHLLDLTQVRAVVFDEADRMFDMGFKDDMKYILRRVPQDRQFLVFSATLNFDVLNTAYEFGANPVEVNVSRDQAKAENVVDEIFHVGHTDKPKFLLSMLLKFKPKQVIIFSNFKHNVERIAQFLSLNGVPAMGISSLISQNQRTRVMELFRAENNDRNILVATDVAARGLDIKGVDMVINFELPDDAENYVHRIGRTGRAGAEGRAYSLVGDRDVEALQRIESYLGHKVNVGWVDDADLVKDFKEFPREESRHRNTSFVGRERPASRPGSRDEHKRPGGREQPGSRPDQRPFQRPGPRPDQKLDQRTDQRHGNNRFANRDNSNRDHRQPPKRDHRLFPAAKTGGSPSGPSSVGPRQIRPHGGPAQRSRYDKRQVISPRNYKQRPNVSDLQSKTKKPVATSDSVLKSVSKFFKRIFG